MKLPIFLLLICGSISSHATEIESRLQKKGPSLQEIETNALRIHNLVITRDLSEITKKFPYIQHPKQREKKTFPEKERPLLLLTIDGCPAEKIGMFLLLMLNYKEGQMTPIFNEVIRLLLFEKTENTLIEKAVSEKKQRFTTKKIRAVFREEDGLVLRDSTVSEILLYVLSELNGKQFSSPTEYYEWAVSNERIDKNLAYGQLSRSDVSNWPKYP